MVIGSWCSEGDCVMNDKSAVVDRRRLLGLGIGGAAALVAAGCSGPSVTDTGAGESSSAARDYSGVKPAAKIDFWSVHPGASQDVEADLVKTFNSMQSDTTVRLVTGGASYPDITQKFQAAQTSKNLPGLLTLSVDSWFQYYLNDAIAPLDPLIEKAEVDVDDYRATLWADYTYDDHQWMVPYARSTPLFYYNKSHFAKAGLPDRAPKTWMEFAEWAKKLQNADLGVKYIFEYKAPTEDPAWNFTGNIWGWGGNFSKKWDFTMEEQQTIDAFTWARKGIFEDKWGGMASTHAAGDLGAGATSTTVTSTGGLRGVLESARGHFDVGTGFIPGGPVATDHICPTGGAGFAIPSGITPEEQVAAINFIKFITSPENTVKFSNATGYMPVRTSADIKQVIADTPQIEVAIDQLDHTRTQDWARVYVLGAKSELKSTVSKLLLKENLDVKQTMVDMDQTFQKVFDRDVKPYLKK